MCHALSSETLGIGGSTRTWTLTDWVRASYATITSHSRNRPLFIHRRRSDIGCIAQPQFGYWFSRRSIERCLNSIPGTRNYHISSELRITGRGTFTTCSYRKTRFLTSTKKPSQFPGRLPCVKILSAFVLHCRVLIQGSRGTLTIIIPECARFLRGRHNNRLHGSMPRFQLGYERTYCQW